MNHPNMNPPKYKVGDRIGMLTVIELRRDNPQIKQRRITYVLQCDCGGTTKRTSAFLRTSKLASCGCKSKPYREEDRQNAIIKRLYHFKILSSAVRKRIREISTLTYNEFKELILQPCHYCGSAYSQESKDIIKGKLSSDVVVKFNGIDRVDNQKGYEADNCVPCCTTCNLAKRLMSKKEFLQWIEKVYLFQKAKGMIG